MQSLGIGTFVILSSFVIRHSSFAAVLAGQRSGIRLGFFTMTQSLPRPDVIITHESDLDGLVAGILLQRLAYELFNAEVRLEAYHYNNWRQRDLREKSGWVTDLTFEPRLDKPNWAVIDHHATETPAKTATFIHDINKS